MNKNNSTQHSEYQNTSHEDYLRSDVENSTANDDEIDMSNKKYSMLSNEDLYPSTTDDENNNTENDDLIQDLLDHQPSESDTDYLDTLNNEIAYNDKTEIVNILSEISNEGEDENSLSHADFPDALNDGDDETDINDIIQNILSDADNQSPTSPDGDLVDAIDTLNTTDEIKANTIENIDKPTEADLLKDILGEQYQESQSLTNVDHDIDLDNSSVYLSQDEYGTNILLDQKLMKLEKLWDELSSIWPAINEHPEKKIKIEELWRSLKKSNDATINDLSLINSSYNDALIDINREEFETTIDEINHILGYDLNLDNPDKYTGASYEEKYDEPTEESAIVSNETGSEIPDTYSVYQDDDTGLADRSDDNIDYSDISLVESILNETDTSGSDPLVDFDSDKITDPVDNDIPGTSIENLLVDETLDFMKDNENELSVVNDITSTLLDSEVSSENQEDLLSRINSEADISSNKITSELITREETLIETEPDTLLPDPSLQTLENEFKGLLDHPAQDSENVSDSTDSTLKYQKTSIKDQANVARPPIVKDKQHHKTNYSRKLTPDYRSTPGRSTPLEPDNTVKTSSRNTTTHLALAATITIIALASWIYFSDDELKNESIGTDTFKDKRMASSISNNRDNHSLQVPAKYTSGSHINDAEISSQARSQAKSEAKSQTSSQARSQASSQARSLSSANPYAVDHEETTSSMEAAINITYQDSTEYSPDSHISDTKTSAHENIQENNQDTTTTDVALNETDYAVAEPINNLSEYDVTHPVENNEVTQQQGINKFAQVDNDTASTAENKNISDNDALTIKSLDGSETLEPAQISLTSKNTTNIKQSRLYEWSLNLSSINRTIGPAKDITDYLNSLNIPAEIKQVDIDGKIWFRIRIKGFTSKQDALDYMLTIQERTSIHKYWISKSPLSEQNFE